ncbi:MAG: type II toxin-antitoxin system RelE/ParE family toxin [Nitrospiraceae bacterium]
MQYHTKVILFRPVNPGQRWTFWDYCFGESNLFDDWYQNLSEEARDTFDGLLKNLSKTANHLDWGIKRFLEGKYKQQRIWEIGFIADGRQNRILGIFAGEKQVVLLMGCYHKQRVYTPHNALDTAYDRAKTFQAGKATLYERKIKTDL